MTKPLYTAFDLNLSELHGRRFELYNRRAKHAQKLAQVDKELQEIEAKLVKLHKEHANEQSGET